MRKSYLFYKLAVVALLALTFQSCKKNHGVDNNNEVQTPYSLYYSDSAGVLYHTNSGDVQDTLVFPADGYQSRALMIVDSNILWIKKSVFYSVDNGSHFNPTYGTTGQFTNPMSYNQSMMVYAKDQNRVYICTTDGHGVVYSDKSGNPGTWQSDNNWDGNIPNLGTVTISSLTQLDNGVMIGYDPVNDRTFAKDNAGGTWYETTDLDTSHHQMLPDTSSWTMWHMSNTLIAIDSTSYNGLYFSDNKGTSWTHTQTPGLGSTRCYFVAVLFNQVVLLGTEKGVYRLVGGDFVSSNTGVANNAHVRGFVSKEIVYKTGEVKQFIYMTCDKGLYRSEDMGHTWAFVRGGNLINVW